MAHDNGLLGQPTWSLERGLSVVVFLANVAGGYLYGSGGGAMFALIVSIVAAPMIWFPDIIGDYS